MMDPSHDEICEDKITYLGDVQRLCLKPGDIVVLSIDDAPSDHVFANLRKVLKDIIPEHKVLILTGGAKIGVMGSDD